MATIVMTAVLFAAVVPEVAAAMPSCDGPANGSMFAGNARSQANTRGVAADIEWFNTTLCTQTGPLEQSWSLSWVSIEGPPPADPGNGLNIFQGGFAKCAPLGTGSCPFNGGVSYHWYFYARMGSDISGCGTVPYNSRILKAPKGNAGPGRYTYEITKGADSNYRFYIDGVSQYSKTRQVVEDCWGGVTRVEWQNEMLDPNDQNGGTVSNHQVFDNLQYRDLAGWHAYLGTQSAPCQANSNPASWRCTYGSSNGNQFYEWDVRVP